MIATLVAVLSLVSPLAIEVPFLPQTDALCGGAAAAMVFRYWGDVHADAQQFADLVDHRRGGIADDVLVEAIGQRGWQAIRFDGSVAALRARLRDRQPVIVLVADRGDRFHYLVVIGANDDGIVVHDPSWGPSRTIAQEEFVRLWKPTNFWSVVVLPAVALPSTDSGRAVSTATRAPALTLSLSKGEREGCDQLLDSAIADVANREPAEIEIALNNVRAQCPASAGPLRELSGVRFAQRRWKDAAEFARQAISLDERDAYAWDVLGSSLFMQDDPAGALRAWNRIAKPRVDLVKIEGLDHARYQAIAEALAIRPNALLTAGAFERARRRLDELPDRTAARLAVRPEADGFAIVDVVVTERSTRPRGTAEWAAVATRSAVDRELSVASPGFSGQGELWTASWRWWTERPRFAIGFAAPRVGRLPGVWHVDASWEAQTYAFDAGSATPAPTRESRTHGGFTVSDWTTGSLRYSIGAGIDAWSGHRKAASFSGSLEHRLLNDRLAVSAESTRWLSLTADPGFTSIGSRALFRSSTKSDGWLYRATIGAEHVSDAAPLALWPGAGDGHARASLLRAHPLINDGIIDARGVSAFGRTLVHTSAELQRWFDRPLVPRVAVAGFADVARASGGTAARSSPVHVDVGGGLRIKIPGAAGVLRVDAARGIRDGASALTVGWLY